MKSNVIKLFLVIITFFLLSSCGEKSEISIPKETISENLSISEEIVESLVSNSDEDSEVISTQISSIEKTSVIEKILGSCDENGIYSVQITLNNSASDKGVIEMEFYGIKGSPQENSVVDVVRIEYYKDDYGTFEIRTYSNGITYQNFRNQSKVKFLYEFGASIRSGKVVITYTPDGGEEEEIFNETAEYFVRD